MLEQSQVAHYLLHSGLITSRTVVEGDLQVYSLTSRNNNFKAVSERGPSYLLKQGIGSERRGTIAREAAVYSLLSSGAGAQRFRRYLPSVTLYNPDESVLALELFGDAQNLSEYHFRRGRFSTTLADELGRALATLHSASWLEGANGRDFAAFLLFKPLALSVHKPSVNFFTEASYANVQIVKLTQRFPEFCDLLDELRDDWRSDTFVHFDIKWNNLLVLPANSGRGGRLKIVDWELAGMGDPCWDVGAVFGEYLNFWLNSIPITGEDPPDRFVELARYPLASMQPALRRFWQSYAAGMGFDAPTAYERLVRSVRYGAVRLVQTAYEVSHSSMQLTGNVVCALQLALNMLQRPQEAAVHLLGIPLWPAEAA